MNLPPCPNCGYNEDCSVCIYGKSRCKADIELPDDDDPNPQIAAANDDAWFGLDVDPGPTVDAHLDDERDASYEVETCE